MTQSIAVIHNFEAAHRLYLTEGKCEAFHGHSFNALLQMVGPVDDKGMVCGLDFGGVKLNYRNHLDTWFDHRLLLNREDPWAQDQDPEQRYGDGSERLLPGLMKLDGDPTTENLARWIGEWCQKMWQPNGITAITLTVQETAVNAASWDWDAETA